MRTLLALVGFLAIVVAVVAAGFFFGGFYNVAANEEDPAFINWALIQVRQASIARYAKDVPPAFDEAAVRAGARAFAARGCSTCHGAPGVAWEKFSEGLRPDPPDLKEIVPNRTPGELFWVIKNGIRMTAMPSFGAIGVPDPEIWSIVAFVKKLPDVSEADYKAWSAPAN